MNLRTVVAIAGKDVRDAVKNRYLLLSMILPVGLSVMFRLVFAGGTGAGTLRLAVYDAGSSRLTAQLRALHGVTVTEAETADGLRQEAGDEAAAGLLVPQGFDAEVDAGRRPALTVYLNRAKGGGELAAAREIVYQQIWAMGEETAPVTIVWRDAAPATEKENQTGIRAEDFRMDSYLLVMFLAMSLTMTGSFVVPLLLVEEKEKHTMEFLLVSPAAPAEIAAGKALTGLAYAGLSAGILIALNEGWSGDWTVTILALLTGSMFLVAIGLLMGSLLRTTMQVNTWSTIIMMVLLAPSWLGVIRLPAVLDAAVRITPTYYLVKLLEDSLAGRTAPAEGALHLAILVGSAAAVFAAVVWGMHRQEAQCRSG
jgi:ABC-2 type transport system permease protein